MVRSLFKSFLRNMTKNGLYGVLNLAGLAVGIACASCIFLWVEDEVTFNHNFTKRDHIYKINENQTYEGKTSTFNATPGLMAAAITKDIPGIRTAARLDGTGDQLFAAGDNSINKAGNYADPAILDILDLPFVRGKAAKALDELHSIVIDASMAKQFFGDRDPIGQTLRMNNEQNFTVTAVFNDLPKNATLQFTWLAPLANIDHKYPWMTMWSANWARTYVELLPTADLAQVNRMLDRYIGTKMTGDHYARCFLFAMNDWNLHDRFTNGLPDGGRITYVKLFSAIAWIILLIACINFMNLATARSEKRAKEVGVRKVMGAGKGRLITQFIGESLIISFVAVFASVLLISIALPTFNTLIGKQLSIGLFQPSHVIYLLAIGVITGLVAGSYPALYISSFNPIAVLKGLKIRSAAGHGLVRKGLVVIQFSISIILIIATVIIYQQIQHVKGRELGYKKSDLIYIPVKDKLQAHFNSVDHALRGTGMVQETAISEYPVLEIGTNTSNYSWQGKDPNQNLMVSWENIGSGFFATMGMQFQAGRDFYPATAADSDKVIINQAMATQMGKEGRVGAMITEGKSKNYQVVGIIKDFVYNSMYEPGGPLLFYNHMTRGGFLNIRLRPGVQLPAALELIQKIVKTENPDYPFEYKFIDEEFNQLFKVETLTGSLAGIFATLAIVISCLGLLGLAAYTAERRKREIGIRKVLGASISGLARLLSGDFLQLVTIACIIAFPVAWWLMHDWLQNYAYHTPIYWWVFAAAGCSAIGIAFLTVSFQAVKAALANPVKNLRTE